MATLSIDNAPKVVLKENDNKDNKLKKVVSCCHSLLSEENDNIDNKRQQFNKKSCFTLSFVVV